MQPSEPDQEEFPKFDSTAKTAAFIYREHGAKALRQAVALSIQDKDVGILGLRKPQECVREFLMQAADELMALGLRKPALIIAQAVVGLPSMTDPRFYNWSDELTPAMLRHWQIGQQRKIDRIRDKGKRLLRQAGLDEDWQDKLAD